jgi:hypothetical protein
MSDLIASLDNALLQGKREDIILRRTVGSAPNQINVDVACIAAVDAMTAEQLAAGIPATELNVILSPTQINNAQWPGGHVPALPPFNLDQRVPRAGVTDKVLLVTRGEAPRSVTFSDPKFVSGELVRINLRISG